MTAVDGMVAVEVADPLMVSLISASFVMVVGMLTWMVRELARISTQQTRLEERQKFSEWRHDAHEVRLRELEHVAGLHGRHDPTD